MNKPEIDSVLAEKAKVALERVCSGARLDCAPDFYSSHFVDHVNGVEHRGHAGIRRSVQAYARLFSDLRIDVKEQMIDTDRVVSRFTVSGRCYGRQQCGRSARVGANDRRRRPGAFQLHYDPESAE